MSRGFATDEKLIKATSAEISTHKFRTVPTFDGESTNMPVQKTCRIKRNLC